MIMSAGFASFCLVLAIIGILVIFKYRSEIGKKTSTVLLVMMGTIVLVLSIYLILTFILISAV